jgi:hypothetical protein
VTPTPPPEPGSILDIGRALTHVAEDPAWIRKLAIGSVVMLAAMLLVGIPFLMGYYQRTLRRAVAGEEHTLPEWDDWGGLFMDGLKLLAATLVHVAVLFVPLAGIGCFIGLVNAGARHGSARGLAEVVSVVGILGFYAILIPASFVLAVYIPAVQARLAVTGSIGEAIRPRENLRFIRRNLGNYALSIVILFITNLIAQFAILLCCVGLLPASVWSHAVFAWALGETIRRDPVFIETGSV